MIMIRIKLRQIFWGATAIVSLCLALALSFYAIRNATRQIAADEQVPVVPVVLLDAGHGGEDGGAVGLDGLVEKDLNLEVTLQLNTFLRAMGYETILTRTEDCDLHDPDADSCQQRKVSDIRARFAMMETLGEDDLFVSIHMNKFGQASARGTQVFYGANNPQSAELAESIQTTVIQLLQPDNHRQIKRSGDSIYLLYHAERIAVMVECGFISNPSDAQKLQEETYQRELSFAIAAGILAYAS